MTTRIGPKGQVVIPKHIREQASLEPGDEVDVDFRDDVVVVTAHRRPRRLRGRFVRSGMAARLLEDRANEPR
jgi:AbrB family looped-hinge helix DNA binding protein